MALCQVEDDAIKLEANARSRGYIFNIPIV